MAKTPQSKKGKGRKLQQVVCEELLNIGKAAGLEADDIMSRSMGANGVDVILSPAARKVFGFLSIECKNVEALNVTTTFLEHAAKYMATIPLLIHKRNYTPPLVTMHLSTFLKMALPFWEKQAAANGMRMVEA